MNLIDPLKLFVDPSAMKVNPPLPNVPIIDVHPSAMKVNPPLPNVPIIDVHTHIYLPTMMSIMRKRTTVPFVTKTNRLVILPQEELSKSTAIGRPINDEYFNINRKLLFMDTHGISTSVISTANPWLDFLSGEEQVDTSRVLNMELSDICKASGGRIFGFGVLPLSSVPDCVVELQRIKILPGLRGVILGTHGLGNGLDDPNLIPLFQEFERLQLVIFLHPHYGIGQENFGTNQDLGHVLPLALGFTFETTIAVSRLILSGIFDTLPNLKLLLAHSGGTLPFLAGRLDSCVLHDPTCRDKLKHPPSYYLKKLYYDCVCYSESALRCLLSFTSIDQVMFGTDNPFFPPLEVDGDICAVAWPSVVENYTAMGYLSDCEKEKLMWKNANAILNLDL